MAGKRRSSRQRATSRRNLIKARQRRNRNRLVTVAAVGVALGGGYAGYRMHQSRSGKTKGIHPTFDMSMATRQLTVGLGPDPRANMKYTNLDISKDTLKRIKVFDESAKKAAKRVRRRKGRDRRNYMDRRNYWRSKPVAKVGYTIPRRKQPKRKRNG